METKRAMNNGAFESRTQRVCLPNGSTLLVYENPASPTLHLSLTVRAGRFLDLQRKVGLSQLTASMLKRGSRRRPKIEIAQILEDVGANLEIHANRFLISADGQALSKDVSRLLATLAEVIREPAFPEEELEKLKKQAIGSLRRQQEQTGVRAFERFSQLIYTSTNPFYQQTIETCIQSIESISVEDLRLFYETYYGAATTILVVVGDVKASHIQRQAEELLGDWPAGIPARIEFDRTRPAAFTRREYIPMPDKANADVVIGHAGQLRRTDPDYYAASIANAALGHSTLSSRLGLRVRDQEGLTYGIASRFLEAGFGDGPWAISLTVNPDNLAKAIGSTLDVIDKYLQQGITDQELEDEKSSFVGSFIVGLDTNAGMAAHLLSAEAYGFGPKHLDQVPGLVNAVTKEQVNAAIHKFIHPESLMTVVAGDCRPDNG
jgi:zinc protease